MLHLNCVAAQVALALSLGLSIPSFAAQQGAIAGNMEDAGNKSGAGARVEIEESGSNAIPSKVSVGATKTTQQDAAIGKPVHAMESVVVLGQRTPAATARRAQKEAPNLVDIATYEEIRKLPDATTAEAVRRIPGISLETDEGEGRYVNIRGLDADLNSTTFGGLRLPPTNNASPFGGYRAVTLDSIPIGLVGAITVTKSNLPSQDAEALGGTIEITPKTAPLNGRPFLQGTAGSGYEPLRGTGIVDVAVTGGGRFGGMPSQSEDHSDTPSDKPFSIVVTAAYNENRRGIDDVEPAYFNDSAHPYLAINNIQQRDYELNRKRHGLGIDLGYRPDSDDSYYVRAFDAGYTENYQRQFLNLNPDGNTVVTASGIVDTLNGPQAIQKALRDERETSTDRVFVIGGRNLFNGNVLDYRLGYTYGSYNKPYDYNSAFTYASPTPSNATIAYNLSGPGSTPAYTIAGANYLDPKNYQLSSFSNSTAHNFDKELSLAGNLEMPVRWGNFDSESIKFGGSARLRHKRTTSQPFSYPTLPNLLLSDASSGGNETYYGGMYQNGVDIRPGFLQTVVPPGMIAPSDLISAEQQFLNVNEDVYAAYAQYQMTSGQFSILGGARLEDTRDKSNAFATTVDANGVQTVTPVTASNNYANVFPSLQARYEIEPELIARATWSSTIARPGFNQSNPSLNIDLGSGIVTEGNANLKPATANSFDFTIEKYLQGAGILSFGVFDKQISNYIVANVLNNQTLVNNGLFPGNTLPLKVFTFTNAGSSYARGVELNWEQHFRDLPGLFAGLGVSANYTYVTSSFEIRPGEFAPLPSSSKNTWNAAIFYEKDGLALRLAGYSTSADLFAIGADKSGDISNATRTSMDFGGTYRLDKNWAVYFNVKNLLNTPHKFYQGTSNRTIQREFYDRDYLLGANFDF